MSVGLFALTVVCFFVFGVLFAGLPGWDEACGIWVLMFEGGVFGIVAGPLLFPNAWPETNGFGSVGDNVRSGVIVCACLYPFIYFVVTFVRDTVFLRSGQDDGEG